MPKPKREPPTATPQVPVAAVFSFLKDMRGAVDWSLSDLARTLNIKISDARRLVDVLQAQGYVKPASEGAWFTTVAGENVSGSAIPRFDRESVERALSLLKDRIRKLNRDPKADFTVTEAVAFGDFLSDRPRIQAADMGIKLAKKATSKDSAPLRIQTILKALKSKSPMLHVRPYEDWMAARTHRRLL